MTGPSLKTKGSSYWTSSRQLTDNSGLFKSGYCALAISLFDVGVTNFLQVLNAVDNFLEKGRSHLEGNGVDLQEIVDTRLYPDMASFQFQVTAVAHHSMGAVKGAETGEFAPPKGYGEPNYEGLQALIKEAVDFVSSFDEATIEGMSGKSMVFKISGNELPFTVENFLMSFSTPNLHFHATTTYDILRMNGVPLGKMDYLGALRMGS